MRDTRVLQREGDETPPREAARRRRTTLELLTIGLLALHVAAVILALASYWIEERWVPSRALESDLDRTRTLLKDAVAEPSLRSTTISETAARLRLVSDRIRSAKDLSNMAQSATELDQIADSLAATSSRAVSSELSSREYVRRADEILAELQHGFPRLRGQTWRSALDLLAASLPVLLSWPVIAIVVLLYIALARGAPRRLEEILRPFDVVKVGAVELTKGATSKRRVEGLFADARAHVTADYDLVVQQERLDRKLEMVVEHYLKPHLVAAGNAASITDMRCTIHVPDFLLADTLYQLVDYYPDGKGHGRTWSVRFGIIGKVWRSDTDEIEASLSKDRAVLIREWGMTKREASARGHGRSSFLAVRLTSENQGLVGLFYADATSEYAFTPPRAETETEEQYGARKKKWETDLIASINHWCLETGVTASLLKIHDDLGGKAPLLKIYD